MSMAKALRRRGDKYSIPKCGRAGLLILILAAALHTSSPLAAQSTPVNVSGVVEASAPTEAATIESPQSGQRFSQSQIRVKGTCPTSTTVELYKNDIFAGAVNCTEGHFSLYISLVPGRNVLVAKVKDSLDQYGPDSNSVAVTYDRLQTKPPFVSPPSNPTRSPKTVPLLLVSTDTIYRGGIAGRPVHVRVEIIGGKAPYALRIEWGDGTNDLIALASRDDFWTRHNYDRQGTYEVTITATDSVGQSAFIQTIVIVDGEVSAVVQPPLPPTQVATTVKGLFWILVVLFIWFLGYLIGYWYASYRCRRRNAQM